jgi:hypothetical protein
MYLSSNDNDYAERRAKNLRILCICHLAGHEYDRASDYVDEANKVHIIVEPSRSIVNLLYIMMVKPNQVNLLKWTDRAKYCWSFLEGDLSYSYQIWTFGNLLQTSSESPFCRHASYVEANCYIFKFNTAFRVSMVIRYLSRFPTLSF